MTNEQPSKRQLQIAEEIRRLLAVELNDLTEIFVNGDFLTIMKATISKDLRYCKVFFRCKIEKCYKSLFSRLAAPQFSLTDYFTGAIINV